MTYILHFTRFVSDSAAACSYLARLGVSQYTSPFLHARRQCAWVRLVNHAITPELGVSAFQRMTVLLGGWLRNLADGLPNPGVGGSDNPLVWRLEWGQDHVLGLVAISRGPTTVSAGKLLSL